MSDGRANTPPESVKVQLSIEAGCVFALSRWNDAKAKTPAEKFGACTLLDKSNLYSELIPAIMQNCPLGALALAEYICRGACASARKHANEKAARNFSGLFVP